MAGSARAGSERAQVRLVRMAATDALLPARFARPAAFVGASRTGAAFSNFRPLRRLPQWAFHTRGRGYLDWIRLAPDHDGELLARSLLAGFGTPREHRSSRIPRCHRGRVLRLPHAHGSIRIQTERPRRRGLLPSP